MTVPIDSEQLAYELAIRGWTAMTLAGHAQVAYPTLSRARHGRPVRNTTLERIAAALASHPPNAGAVRLAKSPQTRAATPITSAAAHVEAGVSSIRLQEEHRDQTTEPQASA